MYLKLNFLILNLQLKTLFNILKIPIMPTDKKNYILSYKKDVASKKLYNFKNLFIFDVCYYYYNELTFRF